MDTDFINKYIENIVNRLSEQLKNEVLMKTHLDIAQAKIQSLTNDIAVLQERINSLEQQLEDF